MKQKIKYIFLIIFFELEFIKNCEHAQHPYPLLQIFILRGRILPICLLLSLLIPIFIITGNIVGVNSLGLRLLDKEYMIRPFFPITFSWHQRYLSMSHEKFIVTDIFQFYNKVSNGTKGKILENYLNKV